MRTMFPRRGPTGRPAGSSSLPHLALGAVVGGIGAFPGGATATTFTANGTFTLPTGGGNFLVQIEATGCGSPTGPAGAAVADGGGGGGYAFWGVHVQLPGQAWDAVISAVAAGDCYAKYSGVGGVTVCSARNASNATGGPAAACSGDLVKSGGAGGARDDAGLKGGGGGGAGSYAGDGTAGAAGTTGSPAAAGGTVGGGTGGWSGSPTGGNGAAGGGAGGKGSGGAQGAAGGGKVVVTYIRM